MLVYLAVVIAVATLTCRLIEAPGRDIINGASFQRSLWVVALRGLVPRKRLRATDL